MNENHSAQRFRRLPEGQKPRAVEGVAFTCSPIIAPLSPSLVTLRSNSLIDAETSCMGRLARPANHVG